MMESEDKGNSIEQKKEEINNLNNNIKSDDPKESFKDIKNSLALLRDNYSAFFKTEIFAFICGIITSIAIIILLYFIMFLMYQFSFEAFLVFLITQGRSSIYYRFFVAFMNQLVFSIFLRTQYGLAYDIMSSGDMFTEFRNIFKYFKKHWWQYVIFDLITLGVPEFVRISFWPGEHQSSDIEIRGPLYGGNIAVGMAFALLFILLSGVLPSLTRQGSLIFAIKENFRLIKNNYKRIIISWTLFFLIFEFPIYIVSVFIITYYYLLEVWFVVVLVLGTVLFNFFIIYPLSTLMATGIYNNSEFERFRPDL